MILEKEFEKILSNVQYSPSEVDFIKAILPLIYAFVEYGHIRTPRAKDSKHGVDDEK